AERRRLRFCGWSLGADGRTELQRFFVGRFRLVDHLVRHAAPGLVDFEEFHHGRFGGGEALHQATDVLAIDLLLSSIADSAGFLFRVAAQLHEIVALHRPGRRRRPSLRRCSTGRRGQGGYREYRGEAPLHGEVLFPTLADTKSPWISA